MRRRPIIRRVITDAILRHLQTDVVHGIRIADFGLPEHQFAVTIADALALIRDVDPIRWCRVQRLRWIVNMSLAMGAASGEYRHAARMCAIDFAPSPDQTPAELSLRCAGTIVHEATHCLLHERGCQYNKRNWRQHERICHREQNRFYRAVEANRPHSAAHLISDFDETRWYPYWSLSQIDKYRSIFRRMQVRHSN
jgi:hypothetical protein